MIAMLRGGELAFEGNVLQRPKAILRQKFSSPRDATKITPIAGYVTESLGRGLHFTCNTSGIMLAIQGYCILKCGSKIKS
jgi:hypothetical protein